MAPTAPDRPNEKEHCSPGNPNLEMGSLADVDHVRGQMMFALPSFVPQSNTLVNTAQFRSKDAGTCQRGLKKCLVRQSFSKCLLDGLTCFNAIDLSGKLNRHCATHPFVDATWFNGFQDILSSHEIVNLTISTHDEIPFFEDFLPKSLGKFRDSSSSFLFCHHDSVF